MAQGVNKVTLLGYVGKAPEIRATAGGTIVANFSLATSERFKDREGKVIERTEWHNVVAFARTAEIVRDYVTKGTLLYIEGKLETRSWDDKESGRKNSRTQIAISRINILPSGTRNNGDASSSADATVPDADYDPTLIQDSDIPF